MAGGPLTAILDICHKIIMTDEISEQWNTHQSRFASHWRYSMTARRKIVRRQGTEIGSIEDCKRIADHEKKKLEADLLLVQAACAGDAVIITRDDNIKILWNKHGHNFKVTKPIRWINPVPQGARALEHL